MQLSDLLTRIKNYIHVEGDDTDTILTQFINDAIYDFVRMYNWRHMIVADDLTLDDSGSYTLDNGNLSSIFEREIQLINPYNNGSSETQPRTQYGKYDYANYIQLHSKQYAYAIANGNIYVDGDNVTLKFFYMSPGDFTNFPLSDDSDEVPATIYYVDIIEKMSLIKFLYYIQSDATTEETLLGRKLLGLKSAENRAGNSGRTLEIQRGGLGASGV